MNISIKNLKRSIFGLISITSIGLMGIASAANAYTSSTATTITVAVNPIINISDGNSGTTTLAAITPTGAGRMSSATDPLSVTTNDVGGYKVTIEMAGASNNLVSGSNTLAPSAATTAAPAALVVGSGTALQTGAWGFCVPSNSGNGTYATTFSSCTDDATSSIAIPTGAGHLYAPVPVAGSPFILFNTSTSSVSTYTTTVTFAAAANNGQASGTYTGTVVFTAIAT